MNGWRLTGVLSLLLAAMALYLLERQGWDAEGIRLVIRATARTSLVLFVLAFTASAMVELLPSDATRWQRRNRRYLGVSFAVSHLIHLIAIVVARRRSTQVLFWKLTNLNTIVLAGHGLSLHRRPWPRPRSTAAAAWLGPRKWRLLHLLGGWYIWISFAVAVGKRVPLDRFYWPMAALVLAAGIVRLVAMWRRNRRRAASDLMI